MPKNRCKKKSPQGGRPKKKGKKSPKKKGKKLAPTVRFAAGKSGKKGGKGKSPKKNKTKKSKASRMKVTVGQARRNQAAPAGARPSAVLGKIYYGSGCWGGGCGGHRHQVGLDPNLPIRSTTNPLLSPYPGGGTDPSYYHDMRGGGLPAVGALFGTLFRTLIPVFKGIYSAGKSFVASPLGQVIKNEVTKSGLKAGINVVGDVLQGQNLLKSAKKRVSSEVKELPMNVGKSVIASKVFAQRTRKKEEDKVPTKILSSNSKKKKKKKDTPPPRSSSRKRASVVALPRGLAKRNRRSLLD